MLGLSGSSMKLFSAVDMKKEDISALPCLRISVSRNVDVSCTPSCRGRKIQASNVSASSTGVGSSECTSSGSPNSVIRLGFLERDSTS